MFEFATIFLTYLAGQFDTLFLHSVVQVSAKFIFDDYTSAKCETYNYIIAIYSRKFYSRVLLLLFFFSDSRDYNMN